MSHAPLLGGSPVTMSYQYPPFHANYSNHSTPPSFWDSGEQQQQQQLQDIIEASTSISPQVFQQQLSPMDSPISLDQQQQQQHASPPYEPPPIIQVRERVQPSQFRFENIDESHFLQQREESPETRLHSAGKAVSSAGEEMRKSMSPSSAGAGPSRVPRGKVHAQSHPYRRTSAANPTVDGSSRSAGTKAASSSARAQTRDSEALGERSSRLRRDVPPMVGSSMALSCPASATHMWRISSLLNAEGGDQSALQRVVSDNVHAARDTPITRCAALFPPFSFSGESSWIVFTLPYSSRPVMKTSTWPRVPRSTLLLKYQQRPSTLVDQHFQALVNLDT